MSTNEIELKAQELLAVLQKNRRSSDWETRMRLFAGTDSRVLRRIPIIRRRVSVEKLLERQLQEFLENNTAIEKELA